MKKYVSPSIKIFLISETDIITTSDPFVDEKFGIGVWEMGE